MLLRDPGSRSFIFGLAFLLLAGLMLAYGAGRLHLNTCAITPRDLRAQLGRHTGLRPWLPALFGLLTGLNLCPPFLLMVAFSGGIIATALWHILRWVTTGSIL